MREIEREGGGRDLTHRGHIIRAHPSFTVCSSIFLSPRVMKISGCLDWKM